MRTCATIFLLILFTATQTPLGEIVKLPVLIEHLSKHKKRDGVSFLEFLNDHYAKEHKDADQREDEQLPFKTMIQQNIDFAIVPGILINNSFADFEMQTKKVLHNFHIPEQHAGSIFHPPRV